MISLLNNNTASASLTGNNWCIVAVKLIPWIHNPQSDLQLAVPKIIVRMPTNEKKIRNRGRSKTQATLSIQYHTLLHHLCETELLTLIWFNLMFILYSFVSQTNHFKSQRNESMISATWSLTSTKYFYMSAYIRLWMCLEDDDDMLEKYWILCNPNMIDMLGLNYPQKKYSALKIDLLKFKSDITQWVSITLKKNMHWYREIIKVEGFCLDTI